LLQRFPDVGFPLVGLNNTSPNNTRTLYQEYSRLLERHPTMCACSTTPGAAAYQAKKFEEAVKHFSAASNRSRRKLRNMPIITWAIRCSRGEEDPAARRKRQLGAGRKQFEAALKLDPKDTTRLSTSSW